MKIHFEITSSSGSATGTYDTIQEARAAKRKVLHSTFPPKIVKVTTKDGGENREYVW